MIVLMKNAIYILICSMTNEIRYVGQAMNPRKRYLEHMKPKSRKARNHKNNWLNQVLPLGFKPEMHIIETFENPMDLDEAEDFWIAYYKSIGCKLTNSTTGGKGAKGNKHRPETKKLISDKAKLRDHSNFVPHNKQKHVFIDGIENRKCSKCDKLNPLSTYIWDSLSNRWQAKCKPCRAKYQALYKQNNPPKLLTEEELDQVRKDNGIKGSASLKKYYHNNPEAKQKISQKNSKAIRGINIETGEVITFSSALKAKEAGFHNSSISQAIKLNKPYRGYNWSFFEGQL